MSRTPPRAIAPDPDPTRGFQPYPGKPFNPILFIGGIWLVVCLFLGLPALGWFLGWLNQNLKRLSTLQVGLILTTAGLIVIAVLGVIVLSMLAVSRYHQHRLVR